MRLRATRRISPASRTSISLSALIVAISACVIAAPPGRGDVWPSDIAARTDPPRSIDDLRQIEKIATATYEKVTPATVVVFAAAGQGSGIIVSKDGYVLTAGHVILQPATDAVLVLADGRKAHAKALGIDRAIDAGLLKITDPGDWPFIDRAESATLRPGQFLIALGHPTSDYRPGRQPAMRLGRLTLSNASMLQSVCVIDHGDSGGPLFDLTGRLVGINDAIGDGQNLNVHIPIDAINANWDRLVKGEAFGVRAMRGGMLGIGVEDDDAGCRITGVVEDSPAGRAGFKAGDLLLKFGLADVKSTRAFAEHLVVCQPGDEIRLTILRDGKALKIPVKLLSPTTRPSRPAGREQTRESTLFKGAFRLALATSGKSVVRIRSQGKDAALGTIITADGSILTKASALGESITCVIQGKPIPAKLIATDREYDLALLKVDATNLTPITWADKEKLHPGQWLAAPAPGGSTLSAGVLSVPTEDTRPQLQIGYAALQPHREGGFPAVLQTDALLSTTDCGGPVITLDGQAVALTIARPSRPATSAIPAEVIVARLAQLK